MNNFTNIKKRLSTSTTMPMGTGGFLNEATHEHKHDGSCCGHDHNHDHDDNEDDNTNPSGGCC